MAASGYKLFVTGDVLTAAQVNDYLMLQTVMVFASSAARTTALSGVLAEGLTSYLKDTNSFEIYDGSGWVSYGSGDITAVSAGTGISVASGTGPVPVVTNSMATEITAKGDLIAGTGSATFDNLPVGTNGQTLVADSTASTGLKWATPAAATSGMTKVTSGTFTNVASVSVNNCFTSTYTNYLLLYRHNGVGGNSQCSFKYRNGGVDTSTSYYAGFVGLSDAGAAANLNTSNGTSVAISYADVNEGAAGNFYFFQPAISGAKWAIGQFANNGQSYWRNGGIQRSQSSGTFDGFSLIFTTNNSSGVYTVYGLEG